MLTYLEEYPTSALPGTHFPKLAFRKLVRLGGVASRSAFTAHELKRLSKWFPTWTRRLGRRIEITASAWMALARMGITPETLESIEL